VVGTVVEGGVGGVEGMGVVQALRTATLIRKTQITTEKNEPVIPISLNHGFLV